VIVTPRTRNAAAEHGPADVIDGVFEREMMLSHPIATEPPRGLSVRNVVPARVVAVTQDSGRAVLVELDIGRETTLLARITERASVELALQPDKQVWALIKAVSLRGHAFNVPAQGAQ
jgi:molybdopterin-binding protein